MAGPRLTGVLLLGGASRRFGSPKALARIGGETLAERLWAVLGEACDERLAVGKAADALPLPLPLLDDGTPLRHPAAGIVAALRAAAHDVCVFVPVDCPFVTADAVRALGDACAGAEAAVVEATRPLPGALRRSTLPVFEQCLAGEAPLGDALARLDVATAAVDPALLADADTPDELERLLSAGLPWSTSASGPIPNPHPPKGK